MNYIANDFNHEVKTHKDYTDVSFYEDNSKIKKVELDALIPVVYDDKHYGELEQGVFEPSRLQGYFGFFLKTPLKIYHHHNSV